MSLVSLQVRRGGSAPWARRLATGRPGAVPPGPLLHVRPTGTRWASLSACEVPVPQASVARPARPGARTRQWACVGEQTCRGDAQGRRPSHGQAAEAGLESCPFFSGRKDNLVFRKVQTGRVGQSRLRSPPPGLLPVPPSGRSLSKQSIGRDVGGTKPRSMSKPGRRGSGERVRRCPGGWDHGEGDDPTSPGQETPVGPRGASPASSERAEVGAVTGQAWRRELQLRASLSPPTVTLASQATVPASVGVTANGTMQSAPSSLHSTPQVVSGNWLRLGQLKGPSRTHETASTHFITGVGPGLRRLSPLSTAPSQGLSVFSRKAVQTWDPCPVRASRCGHFTRGGSDQHATVSTGCAEATSTECGPINFRPSLKETLFF